MQCKAGAGNALELSVPDSEVEYLLTTPTPVDAGLRALAGLGLALLPQSQAARAKPQSASDADDPHVVEQRPAKAQV